MYYVYHIRRPGMHIHQGYIGITNNPTIRFRQHLYKMSTPKPENTHLANALKKHTDIEFIQLHSGLTFEEALSCEAFYRPIPSIGWNIKAGGLNGNIMSEETKQKISLKHTGKTIKPETREKLRQANLGKVQSAETKAKRATTLSNMFKGKPKSSPKELEIFVEGMKGSNNPMSKRASIYDYTTKALIASNINIAAWCRDNPQYSAKQLQRTANPNESIFVHKGIYAIYI